MSKTATIINYADGTTEVQCPEPIESWEEEALMTLPGFYEYLLVQYEPDPTHKVCIWKMWFLNEHNVYEALTGKEIDGMIYQSTDPEVFKL